MLEADFLALEPRRSRLEWLGPIPAQSGAASLPASRLGRALDLLDIVTASALNALFAAIKR
jgi:hypothetical protein